MSGRGGGTRRPGPVIRASELGEHAFCGRAWWLRRACGWETRFPERLERGSAAHAAHGRAVAGSSRLALLGAALVAAALLLALLA